MLTDTHVHFDGLMQAGDTIAVIMARAAQAGVSRMLAIGGALTANRTALEIARAYPERVRAAVGYNRDLAAVAFGQLPACRLVHRSPDLSESRGEGGNPLDEGGTMDTPVPERCGEQATACPSSVRGGGKQMMDELESMLAAPETAAIGEIGLDFHHGRTTDAAQIVLFNRMLALARDYRLPVCVHTRAAEAETLAALRAHAAAWCGAPDRIGVMHCFTGGEGFARDLLALGFYISFSGILTFRNAGNLRAVAALVPDDRLLIETDSPYLAPEPFRGQPNAPAHVRRVAEVLAEIRRTSREKIAEITARNAGKLFQIIR
ncbi:MAG: TatD family hydrolase [Verrucomicrobiota bacterium]